MPTSSFRPGFSSLPPTTAAPPGLPSRGDAPAVSSSDTTGFGKFGTGQTWKAAGSKKA